MGYSLSKCGRYSIEGLHRSGSEVKHLFFHVGCGKSRKIRVCSASTPGLKQAAQSHLDKLLSRKLTAPQLTALAVVAKGVDPRLRTVRFVTAHALYSRGLIAADFNRVYLTPKGLKKVRK